MRSLRALVVLPILLVACGTPPVVAPPPVAPAKPIELAKPAPIDTSPVTEPTGLLVVGHVARPDDTAKQAGMLSGMPVPSAAEMVGFALGEEIGKAVDMSKPVDFAVALVAGGRMPRPTFAVSIPLKSLDDAREKLGKMKLIPTDNGAMRVEGLLPPEESGDAPRTCLLAPAAGSASARLVCGEVAGVEALAPYLTRTYARDTVANDMHIEVRTGAGREALDSVRRMLPRMAAASMGGNLRQKPALNELVETVVGDATDFVTDSEKIVVDVETKPQGAHATVKVFFRSVQATATKIALGQGFPSVPPASVGRLPADTLGGMWSTGTPTPLLEHLQNVAKRGLAEALAEESHLSDKEKNDIPKVLFDRIVPLFDGAWSYGFGIDQESTAKAEEAARSADEKTRREKAAQVELERIGFQLVHVTRPFAQASQAAKEFASLVDARLTKDQAGSKGGWTTTVKPGAAPRGLPQGTLHYVLAREYTPFKGSKEPKRKAACHALVAKDGEGAAIGFGCDEKVLTARLAASLSTASRGPAIPVEILQAHGHRGAFLTPRAVAWALALERGNRGKLGPDSPDTKVPMRITLSNEAPSVPAPAGAAVVTIDAPKASIGALVAAVLRGGR